MIAALLFFIFVAVCVAVWLLWVLNDNIAEVGELVAKEIHRRRVTNGSRS